MYLSLKGAVNNIDVPPRNDENCLDQTFTGTSDRNNYRDQDAPSHLQIDAIGGPSSNGLFVFGNKVGFAKIQHVADIINTLFIRIILKWK